MADSWHESSEKSPIRAADGSLAGMTPTNPHTLMDFKEPCIMERIRVAKFCVQPAGLAPFDDWSWWKCAELIQPRADDSPSLAAVFRVGGPRPSCPPYNNPASGRHVISVL